MFKISLSSFSTTMLFPFFQPCNQRVEHEQMEGIWRSQPVKGKPESIIPIPRHANILWLVVSTPLKNMKVNWDAEIPNIWKKKSSHVPNHQPVLNFKYPYCPLEKTPHWRSFRSGKSWGNPPAVAIISLWWSKHASMMVRRKNDYIYIYIYYIMVTIQKP